jgi:hypothetical protein
MPDISDTLSDVIFVTLLSLVRTFSLPPVSAGYRQYPLVGPSKKRQRCGLGRAGVSTKAHGFANSTIQR